MKVDEKVYKKTLTSDSKLVLLEMLKRKYSLHYLTNECVHQTDLSFLCLEAQNTCTRDKGTIAVCD